MVKCNNCGSEVISSDICGDYCVHCYGNEVTNSIKVEGGWICKECGEHTTTLSNEVCPKCYNDSLNKGSKCDVCGERSWGGKRMVGYTRGGSYHELGLCKCCSDKRDNGEIDINDYI